LSKEPQKTDELMKLATEKIRASQQKLNEAHKILKEILTLLKSEKEGQKNQRWQNIAINASKQCGRLNIPQVRPVLKFSELIKEIKNYDLAMLACLTEDTKPLKEVILNFKGNNIIQINNRPQLFCLF